MKTLNAKKQQPRACWCMKMLDRLRKHLYLICCAIVYVFASGCSLQPEVVRQVELKEVAILPPAALIAECPKPVIAELVDAGDVIQALEAYEAAREQYNRAIIDVLREWIAEQEAKHAADGA